ncbi:hypothetical protein [Rouxiella sp. WC2420]|uniref:Uncharacterized protein n=1 Tax=Rouxiella sp. WC2420 TaxID=3234145 RepID=A0AB39VM79_9GAMM
MTLALSIKESEEKRKGHLQDALYFRRNELTKAKQTALMRAKIEKMNQQYFLGEQPF